MAIDHTTCEPATGASRVLSRAPRLTISGARLLFGAPGPWLCRLFLAFWCGFLFFYGLNTGQLWRTEGLRAIIAAAFLRSGNWIVPTLYGEPFFTKPPGMYAAIALASLPFGEVTEWSARLPSALAATLTILMLYGYFARLFGRRGGLLVAVLAPMSVLWLDKATAAEIDMMQVMWVTGGILCALRAIENSRQPAAGSGQSKENSGQWAVDIELYHSTATTAPSSLPAAGCRLPDSLWWVAALLCVAGGVLTKWTAPVFFYATIVPLLCWRGQWRLLFGRQHLVAAALGASICFAWIGLAVSMSGWDAFYETVKREALQRMPGNVAHPDPWHVTALHPLRICVYNLPWSLVALIACWPGFARRLDQRGKFVRQAMQCWVWPNVIIWSYLIDHKPRHSFPLSPGFVGLAALVWIAWLDGRLSWKMRLQPRQFLVNTVVCWLIVKLVFVHAVVPLRQPSRDPQGKAAVLSELVPSHCILYLFHLKDEGIMFYYGRPVVRLPGPNELPSSGEPLYCILAQGEWDTCRQVSSRSAQALTEGLRDEQGSPIVLVRVD